MAQLRRKHVYRVFKAAMKVLRSRTNGSCQTIDKSRFSSIQIKVLTEWLNL